MTSPKFIRTCSIWRALEVVGDTSVLLILEASWIGARRFDEYRAMVYPDRACCRWSRKASRGLDKTLQ